MQKPSRKTQDSRAIAGFAGAISGFANFALYPQQTVSGANIIDYTATTVSGFAPYVARNFPSWSKFGAMADDLNPYAALLEVMCFSTNNKTFTQMVWDGDFAPIDDQYYPQQPQPMN